MEESVYRNLVSFTVFYALFTVGFCETDPNDVEVLNQLRKGLENPELLKWSSSGGDPCGTPRWDHLVCVGNKVTQIQVQGLGLKGVLPQSLNKLSSLTSLGLQRNLFTGGLPSLKGLSELRYAYFDYNGFDSIPLDFFEGLTNLEVMALDSLNLNGTGGWSFPVDLQDSAQLVNLTCNRCNLVGPLPEFLGSLPDLSVLMLSGNKISGVIPSTFNGSNLQLLWLNDQSGEKMTGSIDVVATMVSLKSLWLHGNHFTGAIPENIGDVAGLKDLNLNGNNLVGLVPKSLAGLKLDALDLNNNHLMGPIPKFAANKVKYASNSFCQTDPGVPCDPQVMALLQFLGDLNYPQRVVSSWSGNDPCGADWVGVDCNSEHKVSSISLPNFHLNGTLSPSVGKLPSLLQVRLESNNITGPIPTNWTTLPSLTMLDLSNNNIIAPLPAFRPTVNLLVTGNPMLNDKKINNTSQQMNSSSAVNSAPSKEVPTSAVSNSSRESTGPNTFSLSKVVAYVIPAASAVVLLCLLVPLFLFCNKKRRAAPRPATSLVVHPSDPLDTGNSVKIAVVNSTNGHFSAASAGGSGSVNNSRGGLHVIEAGNLVISVQMLRSVTKNFAPENELGRGGFGVVYKGELDDGTQIAVKRMESGVISNKALDEFHSEITVLSKVRHRHLVSLLGYSVEGNERILVYEYMPQGALSRYLFHWKSMKLEPLSWKRRLNIALDVARGLEYLHTLAHQSFIHRDLKSSNILLGDDFRAKISDFGLVKLSPGEEKSVVTRLAGTFGYLAPEYAVTGKITTKVDVFSFGVVLMELLTGMMALDEDRPEESQYLAAWFWQIKSVKERLKAAIDSSLDIVEDMLPSVYTIADLAGHCTARDPNQRPDMGHAVNVIAPLVEKWKPFEGETEEYSGIDYSLPLNQMVKGWQQSEGADFSYVDLDDSKSSIPARPTGFADSFTSADGR
ncbi:unnamed protein product [Rhodiola kirilowii]